MGVKRELDAAKKEVDAAKKILDKNPPDVAAAKTELDTIKKSIDNALKSHADKKKQAGGGIKKLSACIDGLKKMLENPPVDSIKALELIKQAKTATTTTETATLKTD